MAESSVQLPPDSTGSKLRFESTTTSQGTVLQQVATLADSSGNLITSTGNKLDVNAAGSVAVSNFPATQPVSGTVAVSNLPVTQPVSGSVSVSNLPASQATTVTDGGSVTLGAKADAAWDGAASAPTSQGIFKYIGAKIEAVRALLAGTLTVGGTVAVSNFPATQPVSGTVTANSTLQAAENHVGLVGGSTAIVSPAITTSASPAYSPGDVVGGVLPLTNALRVSGGTGILQSLLIKDTTNQKQPLTILLFNANPTNGTYTDNGALSLNATDAAMIIRKINVGAADYETVGTTAIADIGVGGKPVKAASGTSLYALIITTGTPTYGANATSLYVNFGLLQD